MTIINKAFKLSAITAAVLATQLVYAKQDESTQEKPKVEADIEIIEVSGLAASLKKSINDKRFAENVVDSINAEDIGKSTDQNIADALSRVTGVSVQSVDGEGARISVRGANSQQNNISMKICKTQYKINEDYDEDEGKVLGSIVAVG